MVGTSILVNAQKVNKYTAGQMITFVKDMVA